LLHKFPKGDLRADIEVGRGPGDTGLVSLDGSPLAWLLPWPWGIVYLVLGGVFHLCNAFLMGLGSFLATSLVTYPAVWFTLERKGW
jgi:hypothetical protein